MSAAQLPLLFLCLFFTFPILLTAAEPLPKPLERCLAEFVRLEPGRGKFPATLPASPDAEPVALKHPFAISQFEVTQELYEAVMGTNPSRWRGLRNSVERVGYDDALTFCVRLTKRLREAGRLSHDEEIRLPTAVEWEYACRAGTRTKYSFGDETALPTDVPPKASLLDAYAWHTGNAAGNDPAVGILKPNPWGLYDMHGYLREMTLLEGKDAPREAKTCRVWGGSWKDPADDCASGSNREWPRDGLDDAVGFRCVRAKVEVRNEGE